MFPLSLNNWWWWWYWSYDWLVQPAKLKDTLSLWFIPSTKPLQQNPHCKRYLPHPQGHQWFIPSRWGGSPDERHPSNHCGLEISESQNRGPVEVTIPSTLQVNHRLKSAFFFLGYVTVVPWRVCFLPRLFFCGIAFLFFFISLLFEGNKTSLLLEITKKTGSQVVFCVEIKIFWKKHT